MVKFTWKYTTYKKTGNTYIEWKATWDGRWDNDPLISDGENWGKNYENLSHPFADTADYEQSQAMFKHYSGMTPEEKKKDIIINVLQSDGTIKEESLGNTEDINPEDYNPEKLMECGDIVAANTVTRALCELLSDPEKIEAASGNTHAVCYRSKLLGCLSLLWD